jgi:hypothetical protein
MLAHNASADHPDPIAAVAGGEKSGDREIISPNEPAEKQATEGPRGLACPSSTVEDQKKRPRLN